MAEKTEQTLPDIEKVLVDPEALRRFCSEEDFTGLAVSLLVEVGSHVCVAACLLPADKKFWNRNQAILGGLVARFFKMISALLDQTCQHRRETSFVFSRLAFECIVNVRYIIAAESEGLYQAFVAYSLRHERQLYDRISKNIKERGGESLPIERRMIASIERSFVSSEISVDGVIPETYAPWKSKNLFDRASFIGLGEAYLGLFGGPSHSVHGNWQDLLEYQLEKTDTGFLPDLEWHRPRPQPLFVIGILGVEMLVDYVTHLVGDAAQPLVDELNELRDRISLANSEHETFLSCRQKTSGDKGSE